MDLPVIQVIDRFGVLAGHLEIRAIRYATQKLTNTLVCKVNFESKALVLVLEKCSVLRNNQVLSI
jgi:hypothetical protein